MYLVFLYRALVLSLAQSLPREMLLELRLTEFEAYTSEVGHNV